MGQAAWWPWLRNIYPFNTGKAVVCLGNSDEFWNSPSAYHATQLLEYFSAYASYLVKRYINIRGKWKCRLEPPQGSYYYWTLRNFSAHSCPAPMTETHNQAHWEGDRRAKGCRPGSFYGHNQLMNNINLIRLILKHLNITLLIISCQEI